MYQWFSVVFGLQVSFKKLMRASNPFSRKTTYIDTQRILDKISDSQHESVVARE